MNYFELYGFPPAPSIDRSVVAKKYFELQRQHHPDFHSKSDETEQEESLSRSADINKGFNIFQDEAKTIEYFLQQAGVAEHDEKYNLPPDFLLEMMEINEALTEEGEASVRKRVMDYEALLYSAIKPVIQNYDAATSTREDLLGLKDYYYKKKYLKRILDRLDD